MLKDNEKNFSRLHMIIDAIVLVLSYFLAWLIRFVGPMAATAVRTRSFQQYMLMLVFIVPVYRDSGCCWRYRGSDDRDRYLRRRGGHPARADP